jgi:hypothetical protein
MRAIYVRAGAEYTGETVFRHFCVISLRLTTNFIPFLLREFAAVSRGYVTGTETRKFRDFAKRIWGNDVAVGDDGDDDNNNNNNNNNNNVFFIIPDDRQSPKTQ